MSFNKWTNICGVSQRFLSINNEMRDERWEVEGENKFDIAECGLNKFNAGTGYSKISQDIAEVTARSNATHKFRAEKLCQKNQAIKKY